MSTPVIRLVSRWSASAEQDGTRSAPRMPLCNAQYNGNGKEPGLHRYRQLAVSAPWFAAHPIDRAIVTSAYVVQRAIYLFSAYTFPYKAITRPKASRLHVFGERGSNTLNNFLLGTRQPVTRPSTQRRHDWRLRKATRGCRLTHRYALPFRTDREWIFIQRRNQARARSTVT